MNTITKLVFLSLTIAYFIVPAASGQDCDKQPSISSKFTFFGDWNADGRPNYLMDTSDVVSEDLINFVEEITPEGKSLIETSPEYFNNTVQLNTILNKEADVYLTFVHEGAGWKNALGFYTYPLDNPPQKVGDIEELKIIFPNVSKEGGVLLPGDKVHLGKFPANTGIGYFILARGWTGDVCFHDNAHMVFTDRHLNTFTTPENQQQTILLNYVAEDLFLLGIEDIKRPGGDKDFNDAVFYITASPVSSIDPRDIPEVPTASISGENFLCRPDETGTVQIELTGTSPWQVTYSDGTEEHILEDVTETTVTVESSVPGDYSLVQVTDAVGNAILSGSANITLVQSSASFASIDTTICPEGSTTVEVNLETNVPADVLISDGTATANFPAQTESFTFEGEAGKIYTLISLTGAGCTTQLDGSLTISEFQVPTASLGALNLCIQ